MKVVLGTFALIFSCTLFILISCERTPAEKAGDAVEDSIEEIGDTAEEIGDAVDDATN